MKYHLLLLPLILASCATLAPPTSEELDARAQQAIGTFVDPAGIELNIQPDYAIERLSLVRGTTTQAHPNGPTTVVENDDVPIGISLGSGLYLDGQNNLSIRADLLAGVGPGFVGSTEFWTERPGSAFSIRSTYTADQITVVDRISVLGGTSVLSLTSDGQVVHGAWLGHKDDTYSVTLLTPSTWTKTSTGVRKTWTVGLEFSTAGPRTMDFTYKLGRVFDDGTAFLVEREGSYIAVSYSFEKKASYRIYRSDTGMAVINEAKGDMIVFRKTDKGWDWQHVPRGGAVPAFRADGRFVVRPAS